MNFRAVFSVLGFLTFSIGAAMALPLLLSFTDGGRDVEAFSISSLAAMVVGVVVWRSLRVPDADLRTREGFMIATLGWVVCSLVGCIPFVLSGTLPDFTDAFFETMSGFTTTGATVISDVESLSTALLFWRSLTQWIGGMGILLFSLAVLPLIGISGMALYKAEMAGITKDKIAPRVTETARLLWGVYLLFTGVLALLLTVAGMPIFDGVCHAFTTISTGGYSTKNASIAAFQSPAIEIIVTVFMYVAAVNFTLHFAALRGNFRGYGQNSEWKFYTLVVVAAVSVAVVVNLWNGHHSNAGEAIRFASFNVVSVVTSTGFATEDYALWSPPLILLIILLILVGGSTGSTSGGIKQARVFLLLRSAFMEMKRLIHPRAVVPLRFAGMSVGHEVFVTIASFVTLYIAIFAFASFLLMLLGLDLLSATSASAAALSNLGPGLGSVSPATNYVNVPDAGKWILSLCMLVGRLELFTVLILFSRSFWRT